MPVPAAPFKVGNFHAEHVARRTVPDVCLTGLFAALLLQLGHHLFYSIHSTLTFEVIPSRIHFAAIFLIL